MRSIESGVFAWDIACVFFAEIFRSFAIAQYKIPVTVLSSLSYNITEFTEFFSGYLKIFLSMTETKINPEIVTLDDIG